MKARRMEEVAELKRRKSLISLGTASELNLGRTRQVPPLVSRAFFHIG
jgi:hypothetical protein